MNIVKLINIYTLNDEMLIDLQQMLVVVLTKKKE